MQVVKNTYMQSNVNAVHDENADSDREFLLQQQRACHARARQYSLETNQRRKALENRRRQWDIQEQKMRTEILQQRKQRLLEITERFQRSHLPPSQRTRAASSARVPTLDEAFSQIQVGQSAYTHQSSFPTSTSNIRRTCSSIPKPPEGSRGPGKPRTVSASQAYMKLIQEKSLGDFKTSQLPVNQLQENLVKDQEKLEQLQTQDHQDTDISHAESLSSLDSLENEVPQHGPGSKPDIRRLSLLQRQSNCPSPTSNHCPPMSFQEKVICQQGLSIPSSFSLSSPMEDESAVEDQNVQRILKAAEQSKIDDQSQVSNIQSTLPCQKQLLAASSGHKAHQYGTITQEDILWDKVSPRLENSAPQTVEAGRNFKSHTEDLADDNNNGRLTNSTSPKFAELKKETAKTSAFMLTSHIGLKSKKVRFLKGILKKTSKCIEDGHAKFSHIPGQFAFSKQVALAIRDSLELSRSDRDKDSNKCTRKKLRWIDDLHNDGEENEKILTKEVMNKLTDAPKNSTTSFNLADPNFTKHAWSDVGPQKGKYLEPTEESKVEKADFRATGLCVPRRTHSAKTGTGTILSYARRDTIIRTQSSSQIPCVISTQGKVLVPRPPPRPEFTIKTGNDFPEGQPVPQCSILKTDKATIFAPVPPLHVCMNGTVSEGIHTFCQPDGQVVSGGNGFRKSILNCTPTDEEISLLWNDVRRALASKDGDSRSLQAHNRPLSALLHTHANSSHVTIKGDSLSSGGKAAAKMDNVLLVRNPVPRPTLETNRKNKSAASGYRNPPVFYQARVPITESKTNQMEHDQAFQQSHRGLSDLSLEEQKILQSLDRLDHRLRKPVFPAWRAFMCHPAQVPWQIS